MRISLEYELMTPQRSSTKVTIFRILMQITRSDIFNWAIMSGDLGREVSDQGFADGPCKEQHKMIFCKIYFKICE